MFFYALLTAVIIQRLLELYIAHHNSRWIREQGGYEVGKAHYKYMVLLHVSFFCCLWAEVHFWPNEHASWFWLPFLLLLVTQVLRYWVISSLGKFWNTRIYILPGETVIKKGPYRYLRHPNYLIVALEILILPLIFQAYVTAILFTILNAFLLLAIRIPQEEQALAETTNYREHYGNKN